MQWAVARVVARGHKILEEGSVGKPCVSFSYIAEL